MRDLRFGRMNSQASYLHAGVNFLSAGLGAFSPAVVPATNSEGSKAKRNCARLD